MSKLDAIDNGENVSPTPELIVKPEWEIEVIVSKEGLIVNKSNRQLINVSYTDIGYLARSLASGIFHSLFGKEELTSRKKVKQFITSFAKPYGVDRDRALLEFERKVDFEVEETLWSFIDCNKQHLMTYITLEYVSANPEFYRKANENFEQSMVRIEPSKKTKKQCV